MWSARQSIVAPAVYGLMAEKSIVGPVVYGLLFEQYHSDRFAPRHFARHPQFHVKEMPKQSQPYIVW